MAGEPEQQREDLAAQLRAGNTADNVAFPVIDLLGRTWPGGLEAMSADTLLVEALKSFPACPQWFERRMTAARRELLFAPHQAGAAPLLAALAIQCQLNEYAWAEAEDETARVSALLAAGADLSPEEVMAIGCYRPLSRLLIADELLAKGWSGPVEEVLQEQIVSVRVEREIEASLPAVTQIRGGVSTDVRSQYEEHPYPRWRRVYKPPAMPLIMGRPAPVKPLLLVAGCGTGRHAIQAHTRFGAERTVAVDLSRRSLAYAVRKTREEGLSGIEYVHGDILELPERYPEVFDIVASVGVLHHMADPFEGVRAVCRTLKPGGLLNLGLYSSTARAGLLPAQALARDFPPERVGELRQLIMARPPGDPLRVPMGSRDFYAASSCRDLIMHVQEHQMSIADIRLMLDENGLRFLGFVPAEPEKVAAYREAFPHDPEGLDLNAWEQFEGRNPNTFARMYLFWAEKPAVEVRAPRADAITALGDAGAWRKPEARAAVRADLRRGALGVEPFGHPAIVHLRANWPQGDASLAADELLTTLLKATPVYPYWLEGRLTTLRRRLLIGNDVEAVKPILSSLAIQCFLNEYVWAEDAIERQLVERMAGRLARLTPDEVMTLACYRPLGGIPGAEALLERGWEGPVAEVLAEQVAGPRDEQALQSQIPTITPVQPADVQAAPSPWRMVTSIPRASSFLGVRIPQAPDVLFAGCGAGYDVIHGGQRYGPDARILAIDPSRACLAYAWRKSRAAGLANFDYAQADPLALGAIGRRFDVIECGGPVRDLDPFAVARVLTGLLKPQGLMRLSVHSRIARAFWAPAKALAHEYGADGLSEFRRAVVVAPEGDPVKVVMATTDFYSRSALRDQLLPPQDQEHSTAALRRILDENGLEFLGFAMNAQTIAAYRQAFPQDPRALDLANWEAFERENPRTFLGMYQAWVRKAR